MSETVHDLLSREYQENVVRVGDALGSSGEILAKYTELCVIEQEAFYAPVPPLKIVDGTVVAKMHPESLGLWADVLGEAVHIGAKDVRNIYFASTASLVELTFLSLAAKQERKFEGVEGATARAIGRAASIASRFFDKDEVMLLAEDLEVNQGLVGITTLAEYLRPEDIVEINRLRYVMSSAYFALELSETQLSEITDLFRLRLKTEMGKYNEMLLMFLETFSNSERDFVKFQSSMDKLKSRSMAHFLVAGSSPMGY